MDAAQANRLIAAAATSGGAQPAPPKPPREQKEPKQPKDKQPKAKAKAKAKALPKRSDAAVLAAAAAPDGASGTD
eukprot:14372814-Alexandrium_andersonii.AAC.1